MMLFFSLYSYLILGYLLNFIYKFYFVNFNIIWGKVYTVFLRLLLMFFLLLIFGRLPFNFMLGISIFMLNVSIVVWFISYLRGFMLINRYYNNYVFVIIFLFIFDNFVTLLRPITLTLRVFINVSLGHFLIHIIHLNMYYLLSLIFLL